VVAVLMRDEHTLDVLRETPMNFQAQFDLPARYSTVEKHGSTAFL
jgi:hypothetical protein